MAPVWGCEGCGNVLRSSVCDWCTSHDVPGVVLSYCGCGRRLVREPGTECRLCRPDQVNPTEFWALWRQRWGAESPADPNDLVEKMCRRYEGRFVKSSLHALPGLQDIFDRTDRLHRGLPPQRVGFDEGYFSDGELPKDPPLPSPVKRPTQNYQDDT
jgi:hypothetical protein